MSQYYNLCWPQACDNWFPFLIITSCASQHVAIIMQSYILIMLTNIFFSKNKKIFRYKMLLNTIRTWPVFNVSLILAIFLYNLGQKATKKWF